MFAKSLATAALVGIAAGVEVIPVLVGMSANGTAGTIFSPDRITAPVGSMVQFQFMGGNHTVTQSNFDNPCIPLSTSNTSATGFHSDFIPAMNNQETGQVPLYTISIEDTRPIWAYCAQGRHCQSGMVLVINENTANNPDATLENYRTAAAAAEAAEVPGAGVGGDNNGGGNGDAQAGDDAQGGDDAGGAGANLRVPAALLAVVAGAVALF